MKRNLAVLGFALMGLSANGWAQGQVQVFEDKGC